MGIIYNSVLFHFLRKNIHVMKVRTSEMAKILALHNVEKDICGEYTPEMWR
jgi:hypothetical protein